MANSRKPFYQQGVYFGRVMEQGLTTANTGTVQFVLKCKIVAYPDDNTGDRVDVPSHQQYDRTIFMPLTEKTMEYQVENLQRIGFEGDNLALLDPNVEGFHNFKGEEIPLYCKHEDYKGQPQERWQISSGPREIITKEVDSKTLRHLNSIFGKAKRSAGAGSSTGSRSFDNSTTTQQQRTYSQAANDYADQGITDEDIPF